VYDGQFFNNNLEGYGTLTYSDGGKKYTGDWLKN